MVIKDDSATKTSNHGVFYHEQWWGFTMEVMKCDGEGCWTSASCLEPLFSAVFNHFNIIIYSVHRYMNQSMYITYRNPCKSIMPFLCPPHFHSSPSFFGPTSPLISDFACGRPSTERSNWLSRSARCWRRASALAISWSRGGNAMVTKT